MNLQKPYKIRSKKLTDAAKGNSCTLRIPGVCNHNPDTVVACHLPGNKGTGTKNHDIFCIHACSSCHNHQHKGLVSAKDELRALQETLLRLVDMGLISYI